MKKVVSVLFSMLLVGFMAMTAVAEDAPEISTSGGTMFEPQSDKDDVSPQSSEGSEMLTRTLIEPTEAPEGDAPEAGTPHLEGSSSESLEGQQSAPAETSLN